MERFHKVLKCKIHRATITQACLSYEGSLTIPPYLMEASGLCEYEAIQIWNVTNGSRLETYAITGEEGSNCICANGAAAHLINPGDLVIIACFMHIEAQELANYKPQLVFVDKLNQIKAIHDEIPGPSVRHYG